MDQREPRPGRLADPHRLGRSAAAAVGLALLLALAARWVVGYLHAHPAYQFSYRQIVLEPPPPPWFNGGAGAFLDGVWGPTREPREYSLLDADPHHLTILFRRSPWVRAVRGVEKRYPNRLTVCLDYFEPVARDHKSDTVIDRDGVILPTSDIDPEVVAGLIRLDRFAPPAERRPGSVWGAVDPGRGVVVPDGRVVAAARLAESLRGGLGGLRAALPRPHHVLILPFGSDGFYVQILAAPKWGSLMLRWDDPIYPPAVQRLSPAEKWARLCDRVRREPPGSDDGALYFQFTEQGIGPETEYTPPPVQAVRNPRDRPGDTRFR